MNNPIHRLIVVAVLTAATSSAALAYFSVKIDDVSKKADGVYVGTAGNSLITIYTDSCLHDPKKSEWASFSWYGDDGLLTFGSNSDICTVKKYTSTSK